MNTTTQRSLFLIAAVLACVASSSTAFAGDDRTVCIFDPSGANGDIFVAMKDYQVAATAWGVNLNLKPYTNEAAATEDFKSGQCQAMMVTGTRARPFNKFSSTVEGIGALPNYKLIQAIVKLIASEKMAAKMVQGDYETAGIFPSGAIYLHVRDRNVDTIEELAGKRIATLEYDEASKVMVKQAGAAMVGADITSFAGMFNNGSVDACYAPATAYAPLELAKGLGSKGGIIRYPLAQMTMQLIIRRTDFPDGFGIKSREYSAKNFKKQLKLVAKAEKSIPKKYWIDIPDADKTRYDQLFLDVRVRLRDKEKIYDGGMLKIMRKLRCKLDNARAECAERRE